MSLSSKEHNNTTLIDISDSLIFVAHNLGFTDPKGKRKRSPG